MPRSYTPLFLLSLAALAGTCFLNNNPLYASGPASLPATAAPLKKIPINLDSARSLNIPKPKTDLKPALFKLGLSGWVIKIPGSRALATPAIYDNKIYIGGGYGSHEFYCFDAEAGKLIWQYKTSDDGPSAAVVEDGCVAFNTESCTVFVLDARTGKCLWQEWLGDPLMSQPAIYKGRLYIAYPGGQRNHAQSPGHRMLCADLKTGKHLWDKQISADVISAPVIDEGKLYFSCMDGSSYCMDTANGKEFWHKSDGATSAPAVAKGQLMVARKDKNERNNDVEEGLQIAQARSGTREFKVFAKGKAPYLAGATNGTIGPQAMDKVSWFKSQDSSVGFGGGAPAAAQMSKAASNLGISSVAGAWGYQGARACFKNGKFFNSQGSNVNAVLEDGKTVSWTGEARGKFINGKSQVFNPPSMGHKNMYLCSGDGHVVSMKQSDGSVDFMYSTPFPISFQPALSAGKIYMGTGDGHLVCLDTGAQDADGWTAWGGNAQHNKLE